MPAVANVVEQVPVAEPLGSAQCDAPTLGGGGGELSPRDSVWKRYFGGGGESARAPPARSGLSAQHQSMLPMQQQPLPPQHQSMAQSVRAPCSAPQRDVAEGQKTPNAPMRQMSHPGIPRLPLQSVGVQQCRSESALGFQTTGNSASCPTERSSLPATERAHPAPESVRPTLPSPGPSRFATQAVVPNMPTTMTTPDMPMRATSAPKEALHESVRLSEPGPNRNESQGATCEASDIAVPPWRTAVWPTIVDVPKTNVQETLTIVRNTGSGASSLQHTMGQFGLPDPPVAIDMAPLLAQQSARESGVMSEPVPETCLSDHLVASQPETSNMLEESAAQSFCIAPSPSRQCQNETFLKMAGKEASNVTTKQIVDLPTPLRSHSTFVRQDRKDSFQAQEEQSRLQNGMENVQPTPLRERSWPGDNTQQGEKYASKLKAPERRAHIEVARQEEELSHGSSLRAPPARKPRQRQVAVTRPEEGDELVDDADMVAIAAGAVNLRDLAELRSFRNPPAVVLQVLEPLCVLLGLTDTRWPRMRKLLDANLLGRLFNFDPSQLSPSQIDRVETMMLAPAFQDGSLHEKCPPAVSLATWCDAVLQYVAAAECSDDILPPAGLNRFDPPRAVETQANIVAPRPDLGGITVEPNIWIMSDSELSRVPGLRFGRQGVGSIKFDGETDLRDDLPNLVDVVLLQPGEVVVYPNPGSKPPIGVGLNKAAEITLLGCMPKTQGFRDTKAKDRYRRRVKQMTEDKGAEFVDYDCETGTWKFRVSHF